MRVRVCAMGRKACYDPGLMSSSFFLFFCFSPLSPSSFFFFFHRNNCGWCVCVYVPVYMCSEKKYMNFALLS